DRARRGASVAHLGSDPLRVSQHWDVAIRVSQLGEVGLGACDGLTQLDELRKGTLCQCVGEAFGYEVVVSGRVFEVQAVPRELGRKQSLHLVGHVALESRTVLELWQATQYPAQPAHHEESMIPQSEHLWVG